MSQETISGYDLGDESLPEAPVSDEEFDRLKQSVMWSEEDEEYLRMAGDVLDGQVDDVLEAWYGFVGDHDFLLYYFTDGEGNPNQEYLDRVHERFGQWIRDTCDPPYVHEGDW